MFIVKGALKIAEKDNWEEGCNPDSLMMMEIDLDFQNKDIAGLIEELKLFYGSDYQVNPCEDDPSRIDFQRYEKGSGKEATKQDIALFKRGKKALWCVTYSIRVLQVIDVDLSEYNF